ncbi:MAG: methyltransferase domain-containing protein, partial [Candidatus Omnitrophota bacterium]
FNPQVVLPPLKYSAIIMSHVLEHFSMSDSMEVLKKVKCMLADDGIFLCEVPNVDIGYYGKRKPDDSPHLTFWTVTALQKAMVSVGMRPLFISTVGNKYEDWWKRKQTPLPNTKQGSVRKIIKKILLSKKCPQTFLNVAKQLNSIVSHKTTYDFLAVPEFKYGSGREGIRIVCSI